MSHTFTITLSQDSATIVDKAKAMLIESGNKFTGDSSKGSFSGSGIAGTYHISGNVATITIDKKPFVIPMSLVESKVREYFKSA